MITPTQLYWIISLDRINAAISIFAFIAILMSIIFTVTGCVLRCTEKEYSWHTDEYVNARIATGRNLHKHATKLMIGFCAFVCISAFTPSTKQMAAILVIPQIANSEKVQDVGGKLYDLAVEWMDELKPKREANQ